ncbi:hypothetical protein DQ04_00591010 [Trypanosoma grayi]|uniref:hypothetical protein n=1 Tax=Trypanosoma grayi TaxID=71804 RepID=UPI0004F43E85|nr:hypothetical protein DQ04_00591010 [Trypanosoma grayi]KEG14160.1 hypothetical protein DQ04_00591010 [Trypanosoma grayi]
MLNNEERHSILDSLVRRKTVLDSLQVVLDRGVAPTVGGQPECCNVSVKLLEKERRLSFWCERVASDVSISPDAKLDLLAAEVQRARDPGGISITDFITLTPLFVLSTSLVKLYCNEFSVEYQSASLELAIAYAAQGAFRRARSILKTATVGASLDPELTTLHRKLGLFLLLLEGRCDVGTAQMEWKGFLPLWLIACREVRTLEDVRHCLEESEGQCLPIAVMLYCYLAVVAAFLSMLSRLAEDIGQERFKVNVMRKALLASTPSDLHTLKENVRHRIQQKSLLKLKRKEITLLIGEIIRRCEGFLRANECDDAAAVLAFAFVKLRWERECGVATSQRFIDDFVTCCQKIQLDSSLRSIYLAEAKFALEACEMLTSYTFDSTSAEVPLSRSILASRVLFTGDVVGNDDGTASVGGM